MNLIKPHWPAPPNIHAWSTLRSFGNLTHAENRLFLQEKLHLPNEPIWLKQIHSGKVVTASKNNLNAEADASYSSDANQICIIQTADCLPILLCDQTGKHVAAIHAGWRGLVAGVIENTIEAMSINPQTLLAWIGPGISGDVYEIDDVVRDHFLAKINKIEDAFKPSQPGHWFLNLSLIANTLLSQQGVQQVYRSNYCTYSDQENFFSYRRDGKNTGRQASLIFFGHFRRRHISIST